MTCCFVIVVEIIQTILILKTRKTGCNIVVIGLNGQLYQNETKIFGFADFWNELEEARSLSKESADKQLVLNQLADYVSTLHSELSS